MNRKNKSKQGFSLMEMLMVVAIVVVLIAVAIPTFVGQKKKVEQAVELANARSAYSIGKLMVVSDPSALISFKPNDLGFSWFDMEGIRSGGKWYRAAIYYGSYKDTDEAVDAMCVMVQIDGKSNAKIAKEGVAPDASYAIYTKDDFMK